MTTEEHVWDEMKRYVGFSEADEALLHEMASLVAPHRRRIADDFYARMADFPGALAVFSGPEQVERLKGTMQLWVESLFAGPWDRAYFERRARIGRRHVAIRLSQHYMFTAMQSIRRHLVGLVFEHAPDLAWAQARVDVIDKLLDLELAVMLHTYREDYLVQMQRAERLATLGQLAGAIGHELRNPLGVIESSAYLLKRKAGSDPAIARHTEKIAAQVSLSNRIISNLLDLVRGRSPTCMPADATAIAREAVEMVQENLGHPIEVTGPESPVRALADVDHTRQILVNLLTNGVQAVSLGGRVRLSVYAGAETVSFLVEDDGPGVDTAVAARLFEPLVTTRDSGVGLGLALCRKLAEAQGGTVGLGKGSLSGAAFELRLARATE